MKCFACSTEIPDTSKFCCGCGKEQPKPEPIPEAVKQAVPEVLTVDEAAALLRISRWKIYDMINKKEIPYFQVGHHKRFLRQSLLDWARSCQIDAFPCNHKK